MSNLRLINETEITSSVESINITNVFSADFDIYKITITDISTTGTDPTGLDLRFINTSGSVITASNYDDVFLSMKGETTFSEIRETNADSFDNFFGIPDQSPEGIGSVAYIFNPYSSSSYTFGISQSSSRTTNFRSYKNIGVLKQTASMSGFQVLSTESRALNSGFIRTYGLRVDS
jgi:hypothetical protein